MARIGPFHFTPIPTGTFKLDGGAMFGVVPKTLWSRQIPADENNRIHMAMRCLLVKSEATGRTYLIDCGLGNKFDEKQTAIYQYETASASLLSSLASAGTSPDDITDVVFTHLHFDHAGGATIKAEDGFKTIFPKARFHVTSAHWATANRPNQREKASFFRENIEPLQQSGRLVLHDGQPSYEPGFDALVMNGHTLGQQLPRFTDGKSTLVFACDLLPTAAHVPLPWVMGYDMQPLVTLEEKESFLQRAAAGKWVIFLEHDAVHETLRIREDGGRFLAGTTGSLEDALRA